MVSGARPPRTRRRKSVVARGDARRTQSSARGTVWTLAAERWREDSGTPGCSRRITSPWRASAPTLRHAGGHGVTRDRRRRQASWRRPSQVVRTTTSTGPGNTSHANDPLPWSARFGSAPSVGWWWSTHAFFRCPRVRLGTLGCLCGRAVLGCRPQAAEGLDVDCGREASGRVSGEVAAWSRR